MPGGESIDAPQVSVGVHELVRGASAESVVSAADKDMRVRAKSADGP